MAGKSVPGEGAAYVDGDGPMRDRVVASLVEQLDPARAVTVSDRIGLVIRLKLASKYHPGMTPMILADAWSLSLGRVKDIVEAATGAYAAIVREDPEAIRAQCLQNLRSLEQEAKRRALVADDRFAANFLAVAVKATETVARIADAELDRQFQREERRAKAVAEEQRLLAQGKAEFVVKMVAPELPAKKDQ